MLRRCLLIVLCLLSLQCSAATPADTSGLSASILNIITEPNLAYILLMIGVYGLIFELANPGFILPGVIGGLALAVGLYAMHLLPLNYIGLSLMVLGIAFMVCEAFFPAFYIPAIIGVVAFAAGSYYLIDGPDMAIAIPSIIAMTIMTGLFFVGIIGTAIRARRRTPITGTEQLIGSTAYAETDFDSHGTVRLGAEHWNAVTHTPVKRGQAVRITAVNGLTLSITPTGDH